LEQVESGFAEPRRRFERERLPAAAARLERKSEAGDAIGRIEIPATRSS
jgi:hypothetical protein